LIEASIYIFRMVLLIASLRIPGHTLLNPIFTSAAGLTQATLSVIKSMFGKPNLYQLRPEEIKQADPTPMKMMRPRYREKKNLSEMA
jgi:hypothetical protein